MEMNELPTEKQIMSKMEFVDEDRERERFVSSVAGVSGGAASQRKIRQTNATSRRVIYVCLLIPSLAGFGCLCYFFGRFSVSTSNPENAISPPVVSAQGQLTPADLKPIKTIYLLGERNSGTNYAESLLKEALSADYRSLSAYPFAGCPFSASSVKQPKSSSSEKCIPVFEFKHMFRHEQLNQTELKILNEDTSILWILLVRNPCDWADGMYRKPWHMCPPDNPSRCHGPYIGQNKVALSNISRESFFRLPWNDYAEAQKDQNFTYQNVFRLRSFKLSLMNQLMGVAHPHRIAIAHLKHIEAAPERFVQNLVTEFGLSLSSLHMPPQQSQHEHSTLCLTDEEYKIAEQEIDWDMEWHFGFNRFDCHTCSRRQLQVHLSK